MREIGKVELRLDYFGRALECSLGIAGLGGKYPGRLGQFFCNCSPS
jgi:hypothetical protein